VCCSVRWALTVHIQPLDDDLKLHLVGHVAQRAHGHAQLLLGDEAVPIAVQNTECLSDFWEEYKAIIMKKT
jgi:hypothetical protein